MPVTHDDYLQAQYSVLGSVLIEPDIFPRVLQVTRKEDFTGTCQTVYAAMCGLYQDGKPVDVVSVSAMLGQEYRKFLMELMEITPSAANIDHYILLCREQAKVFAIRDISRQLAVQETADGIRSLLDQANALMVDKSALRITTMEMAMRSFMERHTGESNYLSWPVRELDDRLYAEPGDFILVGGYPSTGKSAWALQCGWHWARDTRVGFFSLETSSEKLFDRQMSAVTNLTMDQIKRNDISQECFDRELFHWGNNPCLRWAVNNTKRVRSSKKVGVDTGNFIYAKIEAKSRKTDPFMALVAGMVVEQELGTGVSPKLPPMIAIGI